MNFVEITAKKGLNFMLGSKLNRQGEFAWDAKNL